jgi:hypothetical protein
MNVRKDRSWKDRDKEHSSYRESSKIINEDRLRQESVG